LPRHDIPQPNDYQREARTHPFSQLLCFRWLERSSEVFAIVVPCFNEESRFQDDAFRIALEEIADLHLCFVDDGSTDRTGDRLRAFCMQNSGSAELLSLAANQGKAEAVRQGLLHVITCGFDSRRFDAVGYWDADLATPLQARAEFYRAMMDHPLPDMVLGSRVRCLGRHIERSAIRHFFGRVFATFA